MLLRNLLNQLKDQIGQKADLMLTSDDLVMTPLKEFYKDVIYNTMWKKWIEDGRLNPSNEKIVNHFKEETYLALSNLVIEEFDFNGNQDMLDYFSKLAIKDELDNKTRSFIVEAPNSSSDLLGVFSLTLKVVKMDDLSNSQKKKLLTSGKRSAAKHISEIPAILIAQFGKNYKADMRISGDELMNLVLTQIQKARKIIGGQTIVLDSVNHDKVINFYESFGFTKYGSIVNDGNQSFQPMALDLTKLENS